MRGVLFAGHMRRCADGGEHRQRQQEYRAADQEAPMREAGDLADQHRAGHLEQREVGRVDRDHAAARRVVGQLVDPRFADREQQHQRRAAQHAQQCPQPQVRRELHQRGGERHHQHRADDHLAAAEARRDPAGQRHDDEATAGLRGGQQADHVGAVAGLRQREGGEGQCGAAAESDDGDAEDQSEEIAGEDDFHRPRCYYGGGPLAFVRG